ncbi:hypothetical protein [Ralstonia pseudosolanacearum]|uniref:hypothetical protein n=1 Tax=Ralstonia pseudosolanacearum TaxID=1310165 RepID=UPI00267748B5|nr:hypothetical protein [Ralstonia pseudosolanacearum]MDO3560696.1 hypothetical protein [Ralstonia pseudosolanacearum]MDO3570031.1 hypothetical protein [Ralstonia pseudosolanacearum]
MNASDFEIPIVLIGLGIAALLVSFGITDPEVTDPEALDSMAAQRRKFRVVAYVLLGIGTLSLLPFAIFSVVGIPGAP